MNTKQISAPLTGLLLIATLSCAVNKPDDVKIATKVSGLDATL